MTTKALTGLYLDIATAEQLRSTAAHANMPISTLGQLLINYGLERLSKDALKAYATKHRPGLGRLAGGLTKNERAVLAAFAKEHNQEDGTRPWRFSGKDLTAAAGLRAVDAYNALVSLEHRGLVTGGVSPLGDGRVNRFGRPIDTLWVLESQRPAGAP